MKGKLNEKVTNIIIKGSVARDWVPKNGTIINL